MGRKSKGILSWFTFESKAEKQKRFEAYQRKMFPHGLKQRDWEKDMLKQLFPKSKDIDQLHYLVLILRENLYDTLLDTDDEDYLTREEAINIWEKSQTAKYTKPDQLKILKSMAILENAATDFDSLPSKEDILAHSNDSEK